MRQQMRQQKIEQKGGRDMFLHLALSMSQTINPHCQFAHLLSFASAAYRKHRVIE